MERKDLANLIFPDAKDYTYYEEKYVYENNLMQGTENGFEPESTMTRAMLVKALANGDYLYVLNSEDIQ